MSELMVAQQEWFLKGHKIGMKDGYLKALKDIQREINKIHDGSYAYDTISTQCINELIDKLKSK